MLVRTSRDMEVVVVVVVVINSSSSRRVDHFDSCTGDLIGEQIGTLRSRMQILLITYQGISKTGEESKSGVALPTLLLLTRYHVPYGTRILFIFASLDVA